MRTESEYGKMSQRLQSELHAGNRLLPTAVFQYKHHSVRRLHAERHQQGERLFRQLQILKPAVYP